MAAAAVVEAVTAVDQSQREGRVSSPILMTVSNVLRKATKRAMIPAVMERKGDVLTSWNNVCRFFFRVEGLGVGWCSGSVFFFSYFRVVVSCIFRLFCCKNIHFLRYFVMFMAYTANFTVDPGQSIGRVRDLMLLHRQREKK